MRNSKVPEQWVKGKKGKTSNGNCRTDGQTIWSYDLIIGVTLENGTKVALDYYGVKVVSRSTTTHVSNTMHNAHKTVKPEEAVASGWIKESDLFSGF